MLTNRLALPFVDGAQAQKHVTVNESLRILDAAIQIAVADRDLATPPGSPVDGTSWIVAAIPTGAWAGRAGQIARREDGAWRFVVPKAGWIAHVDDEDIFVVWSGTAWVMLGTQLSEVQALSRLGIGTTADAANPFAAKLNNALWSARTVAEGGDGDLRYTMNKEAAADVLSLLMQTGWSGRAEIGLVGDDDLAIRVSANGSTWTTALKANRTTGALTASGNLLINSGSWSSVTMQSADATANQVSGRKGASGLLRWVMRFGDNAAETGSNAGSNFTLISYEDDGVTFATRLTVSRATGVVNFGVAPTAAGNVMWHAGNDIRLRSFTVATVPGAGTAGAGTLIYVSNESGGATPAFSDGTSWRRVADRAVIS